MLHSFDRSVGAGNLVRAMKMARQSRIQDALDQRTFPTSARTRYGDQVFEWKIHIDELEGIVCCSANGQPLAAGLFFPGGRIDDRRPLVVDVNRLGAREVWAGDRIGIFRNLLQGSFGDDPPSMRSGTGSKVSDSIRASDHIAVVFDDQERIAQVAELMHGSNQPVVVSGVQPNRRFIQDIQHPAQTGP